MPVPSRMMPETTLDHDAYVEWVLLRATKFYAMRMGAGAVQRDRHDCGSLREAVETAQRLTRETGRGYMVYGSWDHDFRCELLPKKLYTAALTGQFVPYHERSYEDVPDGVWQEDDEPGGTLAEARWHAEEEARSLHGVNQETYYP